MRKLARIFAIMFLAVFAAGAAAHSAASTGMSVKMAITGMDHGEMGDCQGCPGDDSEMSACDQSCVTNLVAIYTPMVADIPNAAEVMAVRAAGPPGGRDGPPDPYPPRTFV